MKKLNRRALRKLILAEVEVKEGSFYNSAPGAKFDELLGLNGLMDELDEASSNIRRIRDVAEQCKSLALMDDMGGHYGYVDDQESYDFFQKMIDLCDEVEPLLNHRNFLNRMGMLIS